MIDFPQAPANEPDSPPPLPPCDRETFNEVVSQDWEHFVRQVVRMMIAKTGVVARADAEDVVQMALAKAWEKRDTYRRIKPLRNWLFMFVVWQCRAYQNKVDRRAAAANMVRLETLAANKLPPAPDCPTPSQVLKQEAERVKHREMLGRLLREISKTKRQAIVKRHFRGMRTSEIAKETSTHYATIASRIWAGYRQMRQAGGQRA